MDAVLVLADALNESPLLLEQYIFLGHSFRGVARTVVVRTTGLIIAEVGGSGGGGVPRQVYPVICHE